MKLNGKNILNLILLIYSLIMYGVFFLYLINAFVKSWNYCNAWIHIWARHYQPLFTVSFSFCSRNWSDFPDIHYPWRLIWFDDDYLPFSNWNKENMVINRQIIQILTHSNNYAQNCLIIIRKRSLSCMMFLIDIIMGAPVFVDVNYIFSTKYRGMNNLNMKIIIE